MRSSERLALLIGNCAIAGACALAMFSLFRAASDESTSLKERRFARVAAPSHVSSDERLAFVRPGIFSQPEAPSDESELRQSVKPDASDTGAWSTEVEAETEATPPQSNWQITLSPSSRAPPRTVKPDSRRQPYSLKARLAEMSPAASARLIQKFAAAKAAWPPTEVALLAVKDEKVLELHARADGGAWTLIHRYRVLAASGGAGPKLVRGDRQVPEGVYRISFLNPNSAYHVSLRVNYPNAFDRKMAAKDGRKDLGGDIMIHGKNLSAGCLAMGDDAAEELFVLAAQTGLPKVKLIIAPTDFRQRGVSGPWPGQPTWLPALYAEVATAMSEFKVKRSSTGLLSLFTW
jgi:hypothetical protein